jgi:hypothetical protein
VAGLPVTAERLMAKVFWNGAPAGRWLLIGVCVCVCVCNVYLCIYRPMYVLCGEMRVVLGCGQVGTKKGGFCVYKQHMYSNTQPNWDLLFVRALVRPPCVYITPSPKRPTKSLHH